MHDYLPILAIIGALVAGAISPGPSFCCRTQIPSPSPPSNYAALGMGCGACLFALMLLLGLHAVLTAVHGLLGVENRRRLSHICSGWRSRTADKNRWL